MADVSSFEFVSPLWLYAGDAGWYFVTVPPEASDDIAALTAGNRNGFGSVRVAVVVGDTSWSTSLFPDSKRGAFVLPVKKAVRVAEGLEEGDDVAVRLEIADI